MPATLRIEATVKVEGRTGVEMEALTAVSVAALTVYDMCKAVDRGMVIDQVRLEEKSGGRSGRFRRDDDRVARSGGRGRTVTTDPSHCDVGTASGRRAADSREVWDVLATAVEARGDAAEARGGLRPDRRRAGRGRADLRGRAGQPIPVRPAARRSLRRLPRQAAPAGALLLLTGQACGGDHARRIPVLAAVVEMIHTATLVHDDILDEAVIRRHAATVNAEWGNETAVLLGDYLFTHAFHLAASLESTLACRWIGRATNLVCEGEMQQVHNRGNLDLDEDAYFAIIRGKTAELTAVSCRLGAHYAGAPEADGRGAGRLRPRPRRRLPDRRRRARHLGRGADARARAWAPTSRSRSSRSP